MTEIAVENLLEEVSLENPCGEDLEYEPAFLELARKIQGVPEQMFGDAIIPSEPTDWSELHVETIGLLSRSKDLRLAVHLTRALLNINGLNGLRDGLRLIEQLLRQYWHCIHPRLDSEDDNNPTARINALAALCDHEKMLRELRRIIIVDSLAFGRFTLRDIDIALGKYTASAYDDVQPAQMGDIDAAFLDCDLVQLESTAAAATGSLKHIQMIERLFSDQVEFEYVGLDALRSMLTDVQAIISKQLANRGAVDVKTSSNDVTQVPTPEQVQSISSEINSREDLLRVLGGVCDYLARNEPSSPLSLLLHSAMRPLLMDFMDIQAIINGQEPTPEQVQSISSEINSREDLLRVLGGVCDYLARNEPSSPLSLQLHRAMRLLSMDFMDIVQDIAPKAIFQIETIRGLNTKE